MLRFNAEQCSRQTRAVEGRRTPRRWRAETNALQNAKPLEVRRFG